MEIKNVVALSSGDSVYYTARSSDKNVVDLVDDVTKYRSVSSIKELLSKKTICPKFRISVLNQDETVKYVIPEEDILPGGSYNERYQNGSRRTLSFSLQNESGKYNPSINGFWVGTKILFEAGVEDPASGVVILIKKGVYIVDVPNPSRSDSDKTISLECSDKFSVFEGEWGTIPTSLEIESGSIAKNVILDVMSYDKGNGEPLDPSALLIDPSLEKFKTPIKISLSAGSKFGDLLLQLAEMMSAEIFYDSSGRLSIYPYSELTADGDKPSLYDFDKNNIQSENLSFDTSSFINCIYVVGANVNGHTATAKALNDDPKSPISSTRIGVRVGQIINDSNITNDIVAQERADYELRKSTIAKTSLSSSTIYNPLLTVNNIATYTDDYFGFERERFLINSVSFSINYDGVMQANVSNVNNLPFVLSRREE